MYNCSGINNADGNADLHDYARDSYLQSEQQLYC